MRTRDAYKGMCDYVNLVHTLCLGCAPARISIAAPLTYDGFVKGGTLIYKDLFTIYPFENQLYVITMTGKEIKDIWRPPTTVGSSLPRNRPTTC